MRFEILHAVIIRADGFRDGRPSGRRRPNDGFRGIGRPGGSKKPVFETASPLARGMLERITELFAIETAITKGVELGQFGEGIRLAGSQALGGRSAVAKTPTKSAARARWPQPSATRSRAGTRRNTSRRYGHV